MAWLAAGMPVLRPVLPNGSELRSVGAEEMFNAGRAALRDRWRGPGILKVAPTGMPWSVLIFSDPRGWYVNLEDIHQRTADAVYTQDHVLDLWVDTKRRVTWKDEDELEAAVIAGRYSVADARQFRADADAVVERIGRWASPFSDGWEQWKPDPAWPVPGLPHGEHWDFDQLASQGSGRERQRLCVAGTLGAATRGAPVERVAFQPTAELLVPWPPAVSWNRRCSI